MNISQTAVVNDRTIGSLRPGQFAILVTLGVTLWYIATLVILYGGPRGALEGVGLALTYALIWPITIPVILTGRWLARLAHDQILQGAVVMTGTALFLDGSALVLWPELYGTDPAMILRGAAAILWGAGVALVVGFVLNRPSRL